VDLDERERTEGGFQDRVTVCHSCKRRSEGTEKQLDRRLARSQKAEGFWKKRQGEGEGPLYRAVRLKQAQSNGRSETVRGRVRQTNF